MAVSVVFNSDNVSKSTEVFLGVVADIVFTRDVRYDAKQRYIPHGHDCAMILYEQVG